MTEPPSVSDGIAPAQQWVPVDACTLPSVGQPLRVAEFDDLFARALTGVDRIAATEARLTLAGPPALAARARSLADREVGCCSFFSFTVTPTLNGAEMNITVRESRADVLAALLDRAEAAGSFA